MNRESDSFLKKKILDDFVNGFTGVELSKTSKKTKIPIKEIVVKESDPLEATAYMIVRRDLLKLLALISEDVKIPTNIKSKNLQDFLFTLLENATQDQRDNLHDDQKNKRGIWIDLGYGTLPQLKEGKPSSQELQLVISGVIDGKHPTNESVGDFCFTTARTSNKVEPTDPPLTGSVHTISDGEN